MPMINWKLDLSLGNVITVITMLVAIITTWTALQARVEAQDLQTKLLETRIFKVEEDTKHQLADTQDDRLRVTETLTEMRTDIRYLRSMLEQLAHSQQRGSTQ